MRFDDKVVFITGGTKGLGKAISTAFLSEGAFVAVNGRDADAVDRFQEEAGKEKTLAYVADISDYTAMEETIADVARAWGRIDILINNAGIVNPLTPSEKLKKEDFDKVIDINLKGTFYVTQLVGRRMIANRSGRIVNIASQVALFGEKGFLPYSISKASLMLMARELSHEWSGYGITICTLAPGFIRGGMNEGLMKKESLVAHLSARTPMGRMGEVDELVGTTLFLASDKARYINGETITMDGGMTGYTPETLVDIINKGKRQ